MEELARITHSGGVPDRPRRRGRQESGKKKKKRHPLFVRSRIDHLTQLAAEAHQILEAQGSPFRICIYEKEGDVFIDVVTQNDSGKPVEVFHRDISHQELEALLQHIKSGRGLVFDTRA